MRPRCQPATVFLCGDVMTGRAIDQILPHPSEPQLHEAYLTDARDYLSLAESVSGEIPRPVSPAYLWGAALEELARAGPDLRVINLETSVTRAGDWEDKGINYRMHPANIGCLTAARIDLAVLANNHVLDWGPAGLVETIATLRSAGIEVAGAGLNLAEARKPARIALNRTGRWLVFGLGSETSGIPPGWAATRDGAGVDLLEDLSARTADGIGERVQREKRPGDLVIASLHWGSNWGFEVPEAFVAFAHRLIDAGVDLVHGHSSHHVRPIEVYRERLILYGCGDFLNDYEGIGGHEEYRDDLTLMYFVTLDAGSGELVQLRMVPLQIRKFGLQRPAAADVRWLEETLARISAPFGSGLERAPDDSLLLRWGSWKPERRQEGADRRPWRGPRSDTMGPSSPRSRLP